MVVVRPVEGDNHIVVGVINVDDQIRREQVMAEESATFSEIIKALAMRYEVIYYVNIITNEYKEYTSSEKYAKLDIGVTGNDFFEETKRNLKRDIYPDDYHMMAESMNKSTLLSNLRETGSTSLNYRLILDDRPQYVTLFAIRPKEDSEHIIIAVANVDAAKRRENAFREALGSAMDMANRDALTSVKNKHAYFQEEEKLDALIEDDTAPDFAIVVCDINGLKFVNDTQGHSAGDDFIKTACNEICVIFKHSPVFRIGGDEFAVLLKGHDYDCRLELLDTLRGNMLRNKHEGKVTVAFGISDFDRSVDMRVQDVFERADAAMYKYKKSFKNQ
jgi:diguanylate cyclase (GGDEF)-like protein